MQPASGVMAPHTDDPQRNACFTRFFFAAVVRERCMSVSERVNRLSTIRIQDCAGLWIRQTVEPSTGVSESYAACRRILYLRDKKSWTFWTFGTPGDLMARCANLANQSRLTPAPAAISRWLMSVAVSINSYVR